MKKKAKGWVSDVVEVMVFMNYEFRGEGVGVGGLM